MKSRKFASVGVDVGALIRVWSRNGFVGGTIGLQVFGSVQPSSSGRLGFCKMSNRPFGMKLEQPPVPGRQAVAYGAGKREIARAPERTGPCFTQLPPTTTDRR